MRMGKQLGIDTTWRGRSHKMEGEPNGSEWGEEGCLRRVIHGSNRTRELILRVGRIRIRLIGGLTVR
jgi:hypothetical protein